MNDEIEIDQLKHTIIENAKFYREVYNEIFDATDEDHELNELLTESVKTRLNNVAELIELKVTNKAQNQALHSVRNSCATLEEFEEKFSELRTEAEKKRVKVKNMVDYKEAKKMLENMNDIPEESGARDNDDLEMVATDGDIFSLYDPWSKCLLRNPVKNSICGHIYDSESVNSVIKDNLSTRCPILGCNNRDFITPSHLIVDNELCERVKERLTTESNEGAESDSE
ncbi:uncharacterized protein Dwil_GK19230 [Drosophila willistoni]|uniref:E3 SUMO-protein ligase NSE2 n=1 Tax=Drosophila willistoni TaxID=7260 RepID=B4NQ15_DROWI|nr:E3 SUMO-protein ligase MMS21 [Drosophila willistoni]EDW86240.1 uncharacterized protein Dwil_GK19230 [Drosophila willistoni]